MNTSILIAIAFVLFVLGIKVGMMINKDRIEELEGMIKSITMMEDS